MFTCTVAPCPVCGEQYCSRAECLELRAAPGTVAGFVGRSSPEPITTPYREAPETPCAWIVGSAAMGGGTPNDVDVVVWGQPSAKSLTLVHETAERWAEAHGAAGPVEIHWLPNNQPSWPAVEEREPYVQILGPEPTLLDRPVPATLAREMRYWMRHRRWASPGQTFASDGASVMGALAMAAATGCAADLMAALGPAAVAALRAGRPVTIPEPEPTLAAQAEPEPTMRSADDVLAEHYRAALIASDLRSIESSAINAGLPWADVAVAAKEMQDAAETLRREAASLVGLGAEASIVDIRDAIRARGRWG